MDNRIFVYTLGGEEYKIDPLQANRDLWWHTDGKFSNVLHQSKNSDIHTANIAMSQLVHAVRETFRMPDLDPKTGKGVLEEDVLRVLKEFLSFLRKKKRHGE